MSFSSRQMLLLKQLGITPYALAHPERLEGEYLFKLNATTRLLIIYAEKITTNLMLLDDILQALNLDSAHYQAIPETRFNAQTFIQRCGIWLLGASIQCPTTDSYPLLISPSLPELAHNAQQKRHLWQQISHYADYFNHSA